MWDVVIYSIGGCPGAIVSTLRRNNALNPTEQTFVLPQLGAYLVESSFGRRWSLAGSTFLTAFFCVVFVKVDGPLALKASTVGVSLAATAMWAILYGWTPEIFSINVRGSACGIASALSRMCVLLSLPPPPLQIIGGFDLISFLFVFRGGMIAPILGGQLLTIDVSFPVYTSAVAFVIAGICVLFLKEAEKQEGEENQRVALH